MTKHQRMTRRERTEMAARLIQEAKPRTRFDGIHIIPDPRTPKQIELDKHAAEMRARRLLDRAAGRLPRALTLNQQIIDRSSTGQSARDQQSKGVTG